MASLDPYVGSEIDLAQLYKKHPASPLLVIHGGAGNITPASLSPEMYKEYRDTMLSILAQANQYMNTPLEEPAGDSSNHTYPSSLDVSTYAVSLMENSPLFNSGHGAVFTRDGVNECEASVMVSRGHKKRGVGVMGIQHVKNPILLAKEVLKNGDKDLGGDNGEHRGPIADDADWDIVDDHETHGKRSRLNAPTAQGHTLIFGKAAEQLAESYGLEMCDMSYYFTQRRWDEHIKALEREKKGESLNANWHPEEYLPQGTCGAVALDRDGIVCCATSTGGMTNKLTGRIGDTPVVGAGFWAEEWEDTEDVLCEADVDPSMDEPYQPPASMKTLRRLRSMALSGTGNGDSFLRLSAGRQVGAIARYKNVRTCEALHEVTGPGGELQKSAGGRWGKTGEGEGGMIAIESCISYAQDEQFQPTSDLHADYNCGGMFRAWCPPGTGDMGIFRVWREGVEEDPNFRHKGEGEVVDTRNWLPRLE